ncbi:MAG: N-acetylmuramoyl-L-alanine amidase [Elusimicrobia bacterium]|nr:N-acetylmuramoyl-L-alanine amidase [Elusimicrobiota bacterium]
MRFLLLLPLLALPPAAATPAQDKAVARWDQVSAIVSDRYYGSVSVYRVADRVYLDAKEAGPLYGGQVYWYPVSGKVQINLRGKALQFLVDSDTVQVGEKIVKLEAPVIVRTSRAFIPLTFFLTPEFSAWAGMESSYRAGTRLLSVERRSSVGSVRWFSYPGFTRITLELAPEISYGASGRGVGGLELSFPLGRIPSSEMSTIGDGLVSGYTLSQGRNAAKLAVRVGGPDVKWRVQELSQPRRVAVDFYRDEEMLSAGLPAVQAAIPARMSAKPAKPASSPVAARVARRIMIDPGHGGNDPGAIGPRGSYEKDVNLAFAQELAELLRQEKAFEVKLTREDDTFIPLAERSQMANEFGADLFISLHCNASKGGRDSGFEVYFLSEKASDPEAEQLAAFENSVLELEGKTVPDISAELILGELTKTENINAASELAGLMVRQLGQRVDIPNRGVRQAAFYVLRGTHAPAVLVETAYITHHRDEARLGSRRFRRKLTDGIYAGILDFAKRQGWTAPAVTADAR